MKTTLLLSTLTGILIAGGFLLGGQSGIFMAFVLSLVMNIGSYWFSDSIVLAMHGAKQIQGGKLQWIVDDIHQLARDANIPIPKVYFYEDQIPNAFATGRSPERGIVAVSSGILDVLDRRELRGVLAHELSHIQNRDMLVSSIAATIGGAISMLGNLAMSFGMTHSRSDEERNPFAAMVFAIIAPIVALIVQFAVSRSREFLADETGAKMTRDPEGLALALQRIHANIKKHANTAEQSGVHMAAAHMYIASPFIGQSLINLLSTHPPMNERVKRLMEMTKHAK